jgi:hypothetical protein
MRNSDRGAFSTEVFSERSAVLVGRFPVSFASGPDPLQERPSSSAVAGMLPRYARGILGGSTPHQRSCPDPGVVMPARARVEHGRRGGHRAEQPGSVPHAPRCSRIPPDQGFHGADAPPLVMFPQAAGRSAGVKGRSPRTSIQGNTFRGFPGNWMNFDLPPVAVLEQVVNAFSPYT